MGNCQAAEAATVVIFHPSNKVERIYWSVSANEVMASNPGHYVAMIINSPAARTGNGTPVKQLKLLRPDDTLLIGQVYRLVSFQDVLKEFAEKKCKKLGKLLKERGALNLEPKNSKSNVFVKKPVFSSKISRRIKQQIVLRIRRSKMCNISVAVVVAAEVWAGTMEEESSGDQPYRVSQKLGPEHGHPKPHNSSTFHSQPINEDKQNVVLLSLIFISLAFS